MSEAHRLTCDLCRHEWLGYPYDQQHTEKCPECCSEEFQIVKVYVPFSISSFWLVLIIPNVVLWLC